MFPNKDDIITSYINQGFKTEKIVNLVLLDDGDGDLPKRLSNVEIFAQELKVHAKKTFDQSRSHFITTTRSCIFNSGLSYYKMVKNKTSLLTANLKINFAGEEGVDGGALRKEFFQMFLTTADERYDIILQ